MKLIIAGGRSINPTSEDILNYLNQFNLRPQEIVSGGAMGVDTSASNYAALHKIKFTVFKANWVDLGKRAGPIRNSHMADYGDELLLIWDGESRGSYSMLSEMIKRDKVVHQVLITEGI